MPEISISEWKQFLENYSNAHMLQTGEWGELKAAFGWKPVHLLAEGSGAQVLFRKLPLGLTVAYMPKPVFSDQLSKVSEQFWLELDVVCKKHHAVFLKVELDAWGELFSPHPALSKQRDGMRESAHNIQPPRTMIVSLQMTDDEILANMKQKTRYNIRLAKKKGVTVRAWDDLPEFHKMMLVTGGRDGFNIHSLEYYQRAYELFKPAGMAELLVAEYEDRPLAALMVFARGRRAWYMYGASNNQERNRMPTYLLQWEAMRWAKLRGCEEYDLWGVPDVDEETLEADFTERNDGLWGVYRFKRGFGGELKRAVQAMDRVYNPLFYWLYSKISGRET